jgi:hypothetical protein
MESVVTAPEGRWFITRGLPPLDVDVESPKMKVPQGTIERPPLRGVIAHGRISPDRLQRPHPQMKHGNEND